MDGRTLFIEKLCFYNYEVEQIYTSNLDSKQKLFVIFYLYKPNALYLINLIQD